MARYFSNFFFGSLPSRLLALSLAFSLAFLIACEKPPAELVEAPAETGTIKVIGRLLDAKGEPPILGHAHLARLADAEPVETVEVDGDGWFRLDVPRDGLWMILGSAVHHQMVGVPLVTVGDGPELRKELGTLPGVGDVRVVKYDAEL